MPNPRTGVIFHSGNGVPMDMDKLALRVVRRAVEASGLAVVRLARVPAGMASNLHELGANEKIVQRVLQHASQT